MFWKNRGGVTRMFILGALGLLLICGCATVWSLVDGGPSTRARTAASLPSATSTVPPVVTSSPAPTATQVTMAVTSEPAAMVAATSQATTPPLPPKVQAMQTAWAEEPEVRSLGLGRKQILWELDHIHSREQPPYLTYDLMTVWVLYSGDRISHLERNPDTPFATVEAAVADALQYAPLDTVYVRTYRPNPMPELVVNVYTSEYLAEVFEAKLFGDADPGTFIIVVPDYKDSAGRAVMALGNQP